MAYHFFTPWLKRLADGDVGDWAALDIRVIPCMSNTTADTERDAATVGDLTTLDEFDGSGMTRHDLAGLATSQDDANDCAELDADNGTFGATLGQGARALAGFLYVERVDGGNADRLIAWNDTGGFPITVPGGGALDQEFDAQGFIHFKTGS